MSWHTDRNELPLIIIKGKFSSLELSFIYLLVTAGNVVSSAVIKLIFVQHKFFQLNFCH